MSQSTVTAAAVGDTTGKKDVGSERNPYAAMEPGSERFKWFNGPKFIIHLYDVYRTTCYNLYEWLRKVSSEGSINTRPR